MVTEQTALRAGTIVRALGGFYYVQCGEDLVECRARGLFRKAGTTPYVGDHVQVEPTEEGKGYLHSIESRKNFLIRPPVANLDQLMLVVSTVDPVPNPLVLDKLIAIAERREIEPILIFTKCDLCLPSEWEEIYQKAGLTVFTVSSQTGEGIEPVRAALANKVTAFTGNTGVGKSSLLNALDPRLGLETGAISQKLGRGRHTTRHVEFYPVAGGYVADTPGFSSVELEKFERIYKDDLQYCFREFEPYLLQCQFTGCSHTKEKGCAVLAAVKEGIIAPSRHESYCALYEEAKKLNEWEDPSRQEGGRA